MKQQKTAQIIPIRRPFQTATEGSTFICSPDGWFEVDRRGRVIKHMPDKNNPFQLQTSNWIRM